MLRKGVNEGVRVVDVDIPAAVFGPILKHAHVLISPSQRAPDRVHRPTRRSVFHSLDFFERRVAERCAHTIRAAGGSWFMRLRHVRREGGLEAEEVKAAYDRGGNNRCPFGHHP